MSGVLALHLLTGVELIGAVMSLVPLAAGSCSTLLETCRPIVVNRSAFMAGFIGSLGSVLLLPLVQAQGLDLAALSPLLILVAMVWLVPLTGQLGMNPILAVSLLVPLLPSPQNMGISPVPLERP